MATPVCKRQMPERPQGQTTCVYHKGRQLQFYCIQCKEPVCHMCKDTTHCGHLSFCDLSEHISHRKKELKMFLDKTEYDFGQIEECITYADNAMQEKLYEQWKKQATKLKQTEEDYAKLLHTYIQDLKQYSIELKQMVEECKELLERGSDIEICDTNCDVFSVLLPKLPILTTASILQNCEPQRFLKIGNQQTSSKQDQTQTPPEEEEESGRGNSLLAETKVLNEWKSPCFIDNVCPTNDGCVWTSTNASKTLTLLDRNGKILMRVKHDTLIRNICLSPTTNTLWACDLKHNILQLKCIRLTTKFSTSAEPLSICITASEHIIVGMIKRISKFTKSGELVLTTEETLATRPNNISECPVTHNIAVADYERAVVVMNSDFKKLFQYSGEISIGDIPFDPSAVTFDTEGNLVIGDRYNSHVILISESGHFIRVIHKDDHLLGAVGIDGYGVMWMSFGWLWNNAKRTEYLQETEDVSEDTRCVIL